MGVVVLDVMVPLVVPDEGRENETGLGVTLAVAVTERLTIREERINYQAPVKGDVKNNVQVAYSAPCNAIATVRLLDVQCCTRQAPVSAWN